MSHSVMPFLLPLLEKRELILLLSRYKTCKKLYFESVSI